jgi:phosphoserine phosphatase RsbU/P
MTDKPAAYQLGIYISAFFVVVFGIFSYWSLSYYRDLIQRNAESDAKSISAQILATVNEKIITVQEITFTLSQQLSHQHNESVFSPMLENLLLRHQYITSVQMYIKQRNSSDKPFLYYSEREQDKIVFNKIIQQKWHCQAMKNFVLPLEQMNKAAWSEPYICSKDSNLVVSYFLPYSIHGLNENPSIDGHIICEISLDFLHNLINETKVGENGFAFLISDKGTFITHPVKELILNRSIYNLPDNVFKGERSELDKFLNDDFGSITVYPDPLNNTKSLAFHTKMRNTGWVLSTVMPIRELNREIYWLLVRIVVLIIILISGIFITVFYISDIIIRPISDVAHQIHTFSSENHEYEKQLRNEAEVLSHSLKRLRKTYENFRINEAETLMQNQKNQRDLLMASEIQKSIIPPEGLWLLSRNGISLFSVFRPANMVSGDLYDFFMVDDKHFLITIGDVSGSGVPAALFMGVAHTFIKSYSKRKNAKEIVRNVNAEMCRNNSNQYFLTLFLGILNIEEGTFNYCNAGHSPAYHIRKNGKMEILTKTHGLPLGLFQERIYEESTIQLNPGDKLVLFTDGVTDQTNEAGEHFGEEHFRNIVKLNKNEKPEALAGNLMNHIEQFSGKITHQDDLSLLVFQYDGPDKTKNVGLTG